MNLLNSFTSFSVESLNFLGRQSHDLQIQDVHFVFFPFHWFIPFFFLFLIAQAREFNTPLNRTRDSEHLFRFLTLNGLLLVLSLSGMFTVGFRKIPFITYHIEKGPSYS